MIFARAPVSPYWDNDFLDFFVTLGKRILYSGSGSLAFDELQLLVLSCIAIACGLLGPLLVLRRMTMLANSISHTILLGLAISFFVSRTLFHTAGFDMTHLFLGALIAALLTVLLTGALTSVLHLQEDAGIGLVFSTLFAVGIIVVTLFTRDVHLSVEVVMGNVDALRWEDLQLAGFLALINIVFGIVFYWPLQFSSFDRCHAASMGVRCLFFHAALILLIAASCIGAFRAVGVLLVLSFLVGPYLTARLYFHRLWQLLIISPLIGVVAALTGVALSRHLLTVLGTALSTGAIVAALIALFYSIAYMIKALFQKRVSE
jgi:manganese/zinc/iron transport system permease protein